MKTDPFQEYFNTGIPNRDIGPSVAAAYEVKTGSDKGGWINWVYEKVLSNGGFAELMNPTDLKNRFESQIIGGGSLQECFDELRLEAKPGSRTYIAIPLPDEDDETIIGGSINCENLEPGFFQIRLRNKDSGFEEEMLRFSPQAVDVARRRRIQAPCTLSYFSFLIVINKETVSFWVDAFLVYRGKRSAVGQPTHFILDLLDPPRLIHSVSLVGLVIGNISGGQIKELHEADAEAFAMLVDDTINNGISASFIAQIYSVDFGYVLADRRRQVALIERLENDKRYCNVETGKKLYTLFDEPGKEVLRSKISEWSERIFTLSVESVDLVFYTAPNIANSLGGQFTSDRKKNRFLALKDISFNVNEGETLGIIGLNGSGKTTLLRTIVGMFPISRGRIRIVGSSLLLRPGVGMREELTGRQNIIVSALHMGFTLREARGIVDEVIDFSELEQDIDRPYRYYSDGMRARLVFSVATAATTDVLLLDEILSAGDAQFQNKAQARIREFIERSQAVIVVEHGMSFIRRAATKVILLHKGRQIFYGPTNLALDRYELDLMSEMPNAHELI